MLNGKAWLFGVGQLSVLRLSKVRQSYNVFFFLQITGAKKSPAMTTDEDQENDQVLLEVLR